MGKEVAYKPIEPVKKIYPGGTLTPPKFIPTYFEYLAINGTPIAIELNETNKTYNVPEGKILFITSISLTSNLRTAITTQPYVKIDGNFVLRYNTAGDGVTPIAYEKSVHLSIPHKCLKSVYQGATNTYSFTNIFGFLVLSKDLIF